VTPVTALTKRVGQLQQPADPHDREAHHVAADVVGVVVGGEDAGEAHPVGGQDVEDLAGGVGRVDRHRLAGLPVADQVDEVQHLAGDRIGPGDVAPGQELSEIEAIVHSVPPSVGPASRNLCGRAALSARR